MVEYEDFTRFWQPGRIGSLWDMFEFDFQHLFCCSRWLEMVRLFYMSGGDVAFPEWARYKKDLSNEGMEKNKRLIEDFARECHRLGFWFTADSCDELIRDLGKPFEVNKANCNMRGRRIGELLDRFRGELQHKMYFVLDDQGIEYYQKVQFDQDVRNNFPDAESDMWEAGRCLALERYTACIFHLMRVIEAGLKKIRGKYGFREGNGWGHYELEIGKLVDSRVQEYRKLDRKSDYAIALDKEIKLLRELRIKIGDLKYAWRNEAIYDVGTKYKPGETTDIFNSVKTFMNFLAVSFFERERELLEDHEK